jgi:hypothetical protein
MLDYGIFYEFIPMDTFGTMDQNYPIGRCRVVMQIMLCSLLPIGTVALFNGTVRFTSFLSH